MTNGAPLSEPGRPKKTVVIFLRDLVGGGVERMSLNLLSGLGEIGYHPVLVVSSRDGELWPFIPPAIETICLNTSSVSIGVVKLARFLRERKPSVVISSLGGGNLIAIWARLFARTKVALIIREHSVLNNNIRWTLRRSNFTPALLRFFAKFADRIVAVSDAVANTLADVAGIERDKIVVIDNPVVTRDFDSRADAPVKDGIFRDDGIPVFIGVGRLDVAKNYAALISAFSVFREKREGRLVLLGDGPLRPTLEAQCRALGLERDITFTGFVPNPLSYMKRATALVHPSRSEGFGNVLIEALAVGTQVVCTNNSDGPNQILDQGRLGFLIPPDDVCLMAEAMMRAVDTPISCTAGQARARRFTAEMSARSYDDLIRTLAADAEN